MDLKYFDEQVNKLLKNYPDGRLKEAMLYALQNGGKRIRPNLFITVLESYGLNANDYYDIAVAIEMIHTYSLIHDDLPAMDDDALRRGLPTVHIAYDEATAILAGDALLTEAFLVISQNQKASSDVLVKLIKILSSKSGTNGMVYGQMLDLQGEGRSITLDELKTIHIHKTARLIEASLMMASEIASAKDINHWETLGNYLGLIFQIQDDLLEVTSNESTLGKTISDAKKDKSTYIKYLGLDQSNQLIKDYFIKIDEILESLTINQEPIKSLILEIKKRSK
ncbi:MAG: polyprenyl synthetase family protein [Candidatus Izemoplasmataceae bacterium]